MTEPELLKKRMRKSDYLVYTCFVLMLLVKFSTIFSFVQIHQDTGAEIESVATAYEANPFFKMAMSLGNIGFILSAIILPAAAMAYYFYMKRKVLAGKVDVNVLEFFVQFAFFSLLINIVNDGSALMGKLAVVWI